MTDDDDEGPPPVCAHCETNPPVPGYEICEDCTRAALSAYGWTTQPRGPTDHAALDRLNARRR
jgi:hypothetical protein